MAEETKKQSAPKKDAQKKTEKPAEKAEKGGSKKQPFLTYKGKPLVRNGDTIYYGNMSDEYVIMLRITSKKPFEGYDLASKVVVQLLRTDPDASAKERVVKTSEKKGLFAAMDIAEIWLDRALRG